MPKSAQKSPAHRGQKELIRRKINRPSHRSLATAFGTVTSSPVTASELFTESSPVPTIDSDCSIDVGDNSQIVSTDTANPFKKGSPLKKRRKTALATSSQANSTLPPDWDDQTANDPFSPSAALAGRGLKRKSSATSNLFTRTKSALDAKTLLQNDFSCPVDFSGGLDSSPLSSPIASSPAFSSSRTPSLFKPQDDKTSSFLPIDFRLGTRLRLTSSSPFPWMNDNANIGQIHVRLTGKDQTDGINLFVNSMAESMAKPIPSISSDVAFCGRSFPSSNSHSPGSLLMAASLYWQHPVLPWLPLFPRLDSQTRLAFRDKVAPPLSQAMVDAINVDWTESFESLFLSWKKGERHSFYVCCPNLTALFTKRKEEKTESSVFDPDASVSCFQQTDDGLRHVVFVYPTTSGFRQHLREEGIEMEVLGGDGKERRLSRTASGLRLSLDDEASRLSAGDGTRLSFGSTSDIASCASYPVSFQMGDDGGEGSRSGDGNSQDESEGGETVQKDTEASEDDASPTKMKDNTDWLKNLVSPSVTRKLTRNTTGGRLSGGGATGTATKGTTATEAHGTRAIAVKESSVQALFNLLSSSKAVRAIAGQHGSLPPTLLASHPFLNAQMQTLKRSSQVLKRAGRGLEYVVELDGGPIMPHSVTMAESFGRTLPSGTALSLRVVNRGAYCGMNAHSEEASDWTEISFGPQGEYRWKDG